MCNCGGFDINKVISCGLFKDQPPGYLTQEMNRGQEIQLGQPFPKLNREQTL